MSMVVILTAIADDIADRLVEDPTGLQRFLLGGDLAFKSNEERAAFYRDGVLPESLRGALPPPKTDMDKAWAAINHVLSKQPNPLLAFISRGGRDIRLPSKRRAQTGRLLARVFSASQVSEIDRILAKLGDHDFSTAFDPQEIKSAKIYPDIWDEQRLDYVLHWFRRMKAFLKERSEHGEGILVSHA